MATHAALAAHAAGRPGSTPRSESGSYSTGASPVSTMSAPSPAMRRDQTLSPASVSSSVQGRNEHGYMANSSLPGHMRPTFHMPPQVNPIIPAPYPNHARPTSHPATYNPPSILEPPAKLDQRASTSPHLGSMGWHSPSPLQHSPTSSHGYYQDVDYGHNSQLAYYNSSGVRSSASPLYDTRPRMPERLMQQTDFLIS